MHIQTQKKSKKTNTKKIQKDKHKKNPKRQTQKTKNQHKDFLIQYTEDKHENLFANNSATR